MTRWAINNLADMDTIIGSVVFEFIGACLKWFFNFIYSLIKGKEPTSFKKIWGGKEDAEYYEVVLGGVSNIFLGLIVTVIILSFLIYLGL